MIKVWRCSVPNRLELPEKPPRCAGAGDAGKSGLVQDDGDRMLHGTTRLGYMQCIQEKGIVARFPASLLSLQVTSRFSDACVQYVAASQCLSSSGSNVMSLHVTRR